MLTEQEHKEDIKDQHYQRGLAIFFVGYWIGFGICWFFATIS